MPPVIQNVLDRVGGLRQAMIILVGLAAAGLIFGVSRWATAPTWVPAFADVPMENVGKMTDKLTEAGIPFRLGAGGNEIEVATTDVAKARVVLAREGMPAAGRPGLELFDQPSWGMTDFTQRINYRRALEGELERTIGKMRGVEGAQVHIAMQEGSSAFRRSDKPTEASVVLKLEGGATPPADVVQGIAHLVASSVDGIVSENVTVLDDAGRMLSDDNESGSLVGLSSRQLGVQREVEGYLEKKAERMVAQIVGAGNTRVQVSAAINFDRVERTTQSVDPEKQAVSTEQRAEITPGAQGGAASSNVATSYENTTSTENFSGAIGNVRRLTVAVLVNDKATAGAASGAAPAATPRTAAELARIDTLVRNAVGLDSTRGDVLSVVNVSFDAALPTAQDSMPTPTLLERVQGGQKTLLTGFAFLLMAAVAFAAIRALKPVHAAAQLPGPSPSMTSLPEHHEQVILVAPPASTEPIILQEIANPIRDQVVATVEQRPEASARVVRTWLRED
jgi:flagellar M-ring protein FliF